MTTRRLPRLPLVLLTRVSASARHDSLVADIIEQFHQGRSVAWVWRQTLSAIAAGRTYELRYHKNTFA
jgi:hypothetical protein